MDTSYETKPDDSLSNERVPQRGSDDGTQTPQENFQSPPGVDTMEDDESSCCWRNTKSVLMCIAYPFIRFFEVACLRTLQPDDVFAIRMRKFLIVALMITIPASLYSLAQMIFTRILGRSGDWWYNASGTPAPGATPSPLSIKGSNDALASVIIYIFIYFARIVVNLFCFIMLHRMRAVPVWMFNLNIITNIVADFANAFVNGSNSMSHTVIAFGGVAVVGDARPVWLPLCIVSLTLFVNTVNITTGTFLVPPNHPEVPDLLSLLPSVAGVCAFCVGFVSLMRQHSESLVEQASMAATLSLRVAQLLKDYDTDAVRDALLEYNEDSNADRRLSAALQGIVEDLETYRPHLPNYLIRSKRQARRKKRNKSRSADGEASGEGKRKRKSGSAAAGGDQQISDPMPMVLSRENSIVENNATFDNVSITVPGDDVNSITEDNDYVAISDVDPAAGHGQTSSATKPITATSPTNPALTSLPSVTMGKRQTTANPSVLKEAKPTAALNPLEPLSLVDIDSTGTNSTVLSPAGKPARNLGVGGRQHSSLVTACSVNVMWKQGQGRDYQQPLTPQRSVDRRNLFIVVVNDIAENTHASIHSFLGDRLIVTWNATRWVSRPEKLAATFALKLRAAIKRDYTIVPHGGPGANTTATMMCLYRELSRMSTMTVSRFAESCFAGGSKFRIFSCAGKELWDTSTRGIARTDKLGLDVIDHATREGCCVDIVTRGLCLLEPPAARNQTPSRQGHSSPVTDGGLEPQDFDEKMLKICLYELIGERVALEKQVYGPGGLAQSMRGGHGGKTGHNDGEWMYNLPNGGSAPPPDDLGPIFRPRPPPAAHATANAHPTAFTFESNEAVTQALHYFAVGKRDDAARILNRLMSAATPADEAALAPFVNQPGLQHLKSEVELAGGVTDIGLGLDTGNIMKSRSIVDFHHTDDLSTTESEESEADSSDGGDGARR